MAWLTYCLSSADCSVLWISAFCDLTLHSATCKTVKKKGKEKKKGDRGGLGKISWCFLLKLAGWRLDSAIPRWDALPCLNCISLLGLVGFSWQFVLEIVILYYFCSLFVRDGKWLLQRTFRTVLVVFYEAEILIDCCRSYFGFFFSNILTLHISFC